MEAEEQVPTKTTMPKIGATMTTHQRRRPETATTVESTQVGADEHEGGRGRRQYAEQNDPPAIARFSAGVAISGDGWRGHPGYAFGPARRVRSISSAKRLRLACFL